MSRLTRAVWSLLLLCIVLVRGDEDEGSSINLISCGSDLGMDQAEVWFNVRRYSDDSASIFDGDVQLVATNGNCDDCKQSVVLEGLSSNASNICASLLTSYSWTFTLHDGSTGINYASVTRHLGEHGVYYFTATLEGTSLSSISTLDIDESTSPDDAYAALIITLSVLGAMAILAFLLPWIRYNFIPRDVDIMLFGRDGDSTTQRKRVAFEDEATPSRTTIGTAGAGGVPHTPVSVVSDTDGGIWKHRQSVTYGELSTPLVASEEREVPPLSPLPPSPGLAEATTPGSVPDKAAISKRRDGSSIDTTTNNTSKKSSRLDCLDAFRGMCITLMIFVNYGGGGYYFFDHAPWNGLTFADLLFPWFIWIMGTSMAISMKHVHNDKSLRARCEALVVDSRGDNSSSGVGSGKNNHNDGEERSPMMGGGQSGSDSAVATTGGAQASGSSGFASKSLARDWDQWKKVLRRSAILFCIGLFLNGSNNLATYRIPGVLQYFAIANLVVAGTILALKERTCTALVEFEMEAEQAGLAPGSTKLPPRCSSQQEVVEEEPRESFLVTILGSPIKQGPSVQRTSGGANSGSSIGGGLGLHNGGDGKLENDGSAEAMANTVVKHYCCPALLNSIDPRRSILWCYKYEYAVMATLWVVYVSICLWAKAPGCPRGYNGAGGIADEGNYPDCTGGIHRYIDVSIFGESHIYDGPTCTELYGCQSYDPEGLLGSLTACTLTYTGVVTGRILVHFTGHSDRTRLWLSIGLVLIFVSACLCGFSQNDGLIPINKNLWSASFGLITGGGGMVLLSIFFYCIDVRKWWSGRPFTYLGLNPILLFCCHEFFQEYFPFSWYVAIPTHANTIAMNVIGVSLWAAVAWYCHSIKFFVKI